MGYCYIWLGIPILLIRGCVSITIQFIYNTPVYRPSFFIPLGLCPRSNRFYHELKTTITPSPCDECSLCQEYLFPLLRPDSPFLDNPVHPLRDNITCDAKSYQTSSNGKEPLQVALVLSHLSARNPVFTKPLKDIPPVQEPTRSYPTYQ